MERVPQVYIISGGLMVPVAPHFSVCAPGFGEAGRLIHKYMMGNNYRDQMDTHLIESAMAGGALGGAYQSVFHFLNLQPPSKRLETNQDLQFLLNALISSPHTKIIFLPVAVCDWDPTSIWNHSVGSYEEVQGKEGKRLSAREMEVDKLSKNGELLSVRFRPAEKFLKRIRQERKDIFVVSFSHTAGASREAQYSKALSMLKEGSVNLVLANDVRTKNNMIVAPEETIYHESTDRERVLSKLVDMTVSRSSNTFTRSTVKDGPLIPWTSSMIPSTLREVVDYCISAGAYKPFKGATAGHFAFKVDKNKVLTSVRKSNFNQLSNNGMVLVEYEGLDKVIAYGAKPSVGGQSQRIIFDTYPEMDSIVHFHCPPKNPDLVPHAPQEWNECGSHQCGKNTAMHLQDAEVHGIRWKGVKVVYLDNHGPNIVFNSKAVKASEVIDFIQSRFDLSKKTGGIVPRDDENRWKDC